MAEKAQATRPRWYRRRYGLVCGILIAIVASWGVFSTWATRDQSFGVGDDATYYALARELAHGQIVYKNYVHFKTPAASFLEAGAIKIYGDNQKAVVLGIKAEINVLYPVVFLTGVYLLFRRSRNPWYCLIGALAMLYIPPIAGLRAGFAFLSVCIYLMAYESKGRARNWLLLGAGAATGVAFMFGQDMMLVSAAVLASGELFRRQEEGALRRLRWLVGGALLGAAPLLLYVLILSNVGTFLYYIGYYGLVLQPKFMDTPFPSFGYSSIIYYIPFTLYFLCFLQLIWDRRSRSFDALLLSFGILRLISALGRSDFGHLLFSIPELFIIVPYFLVHMPSMRTDRQRVKQMWPYVVALLIVFGVAITTTSLILLIVPILCLLALRHTKVPSAKLAPSPLRFNLYAIASALSVLLVFMLFPAAYGTAQGVKIGLFNGPGPYTIDGLTTDQVTYGEVTQISDAVKQYHPQTIFSFPIQAYYYSLAPHMASRFVTFEPETTLKEQNEAITDLQHSKPQVVVFDVLEAQGFSASVWKISEYVQQNYQIVKTVTTRDVLLVMVPRETSQRSYSLVYQLLKDNPSTKAQGLHMFDQGIADALYQPDGTIRFTIDGTNASTSLRIGVLQNPASPTAPCGTVSIQADGLAKQIHLCDQDGIQDLPIGAHKQVTITLKADGKQPISWNDLDIVTAK